MCKKLLVLTKSCWSRTDGPALVVNTENHWVAISLLLFWGVCLLGRAEYMPTLMPCRACNHKIYVPWDKIYMPRACRHALICRARCWLWFVTLKIYVELTRPKIESRDPIFFTGTRARSRVSGNDRLLQRGSEFGRNPEIPASPVIQLQPQPANVSQSLTPNHLLCLHCESP